MRQDLFSVYDVVHYLKQTLDHDYKLQSIFIKGEISNYTNHRSGHWYFTLKDKRSKISCVMFASHAARCPLKVREGMQVIVQASVTLYEVGGTLQLNVTKMQLDGLGELYLQLEQVKKQLLQEGLFDPARKKPLPQYPMSIGVIAAKTGAAVQDVLTTIARRWPIAEVVVYPSLVQGIQATKDIVKNLKKADERHHDVILLTRGGGPIEDLWCFNEEEVARCIANMETIVVSGVGHETDTTLVDYVSDARAATPTAAAELITPDMVDVIDQLEHMITTLKHRFLTLLQEQKAAFHRLCSHRYLQDPNSYIRESQMKLAMHVQELGVVEKQLQVTKTSLNEQSNQLASLASKIQHASMQRVMQNQLQLLHSMQNYKMYQTQYFKQQTSLLDAYSPLKVLQRGYAIAQKDDVCIKSIHDVDVDDRLSLRLSDGIVSAHVISKENR